MPGIKGMKMPPNTKSLRQNMWRSIRIMRRFTIPDLLRTVPGLKYENARKFLRNLEDHKYIAKVGAHVSGRSGSFQQYSLSKDTGPTVPVMNIGRSSKFLKGGKETKKEKETEKETNKETESPPGEVTHDAA